LGLMFVALRLGGLGVLFGLATTAGLVKIVSKIAADDDLFKAAAGTGAVGVTARTEGEHEMVGLMVGDEDEDEGEGEAGGGAAPYGRAVVGSSEKAKKSPHAKAAQGAAALAMEGGEDFVPPPAWEGTSDYNPLTPRGR
jgi:hypothetical protein